MLRPPGKWRRKWLVCSPRSWGMAKCGRPRKSPPSMKSRAATCWLLPLTLDDMQKAAQFVASLTPLCPKIGLVLGSGLGKFAEGLANATHIPYREIPGFPVSTAIGHKGELVIGS